MTDPVPAKFVFKSKTLEIEFEGRADFVGGQIEFMRGAIHAAVVARPAPTPAPAPVAATASAPASLPTSAAAAPAATPAAAAAPAAPAAAAPAAEVSLEAFYKRAKSRVGRGALQETILIFAYFLRDHRNKEEFGIDNLNACFSLVGVVPPKSLANTLGIMKRVNKFFESGTRRGTYALTDKGNAYVRKMIGG